MNISRGFLITGAIYLVIGMALGSYMGASADHSLVPVHAHMNLLGFVLMSIFGLIYRSLPGLTRSRLSVLHYALHQLGTLSLLIGLLVLLTGVLPAAQVGPFMLVPELALIFGTLIFLLNLLRSSW